MRYNVDTKLFGDFTFTKFNANGEFTYEKGFLSGFDMKYSLYRRNENFQT